MLPDGNSKLIQDYKIIKSPAKTYRMDIEKERIAGYSDQIEAVKQTVYCILNTERYENLIYSWNYGTELKNLYGRPIPYVKSELKRRIREALLQDDRIQNVTSFSFTERGGKLTAEFSVETDCGEIRMEKEVTVNV